MKSVRNVFLGEVLGIHLSFLIQRSLTPEKNYRAARARGGSPSETKKDGLLE